MAKRDEWDRPVFAALLMTLAAGIAAGAVLGAALFGMMTGGGYV